MSFTETLWFLQMWMTVPASPVRTEASVEILTAISPVNVPHPMWESTANCVSRTLPVHTCTAPLRKLFSLYFLHIFGFSIGDFIQHTMSVSLPCECGHHTVYPSVRRTVSLFVYWVLECLLISGSGSQDASLCWEWKEEASLSLRSLPPRCTTAFWDCSAGGPNWPDWITRDLLMLGPLQHMTRTPG